ncbi:DUF4229 domain-containing protein [Nesterenkonia sphaerica]|uniref:DUF4229 domain-containing protein n=1 Tax=Nesterenkonia sphaerica TaxID=1804988 RepID=A0A5R9A2E4_9MICC|nr:DUF4229 domain-containing protein [Nesterenkonia sphaerica]TLP72768.1 DUF4229 domain-containing protein [Nesterenkonia sphaerica]
MAVLKYSVLRLGIFAVVFFGCLYINLGRFTFIFAVLIGLAVSWMVSYLFFNSWRVEAGEQLARWVGRRRRSTSEQQDNAAEDQLAERFHEHPAEPVAEPDEADPDQPGRSDR